MQWISRPQLILKVSRNSNNLLYPLPLLAYFKRAPALLYDYTQTRPFTVWSLGSLKWPNITEVGPGKWNNFIKAWDQKFPQHIIYSGGLMPHLPHGRLMLCTSFSHLHSALDILLLSEHRQRKTETANFATSGAGARPGEAPPPAVWVPPFQSQSVNLDSLVNGDFGAPYKF